MSKQKIQKQKWKAGNMVYPIPAAMVSCGDQERANIVTVGWTGTICTNPPMTYISLRPSRYSYDMIKEIGYFVINLTTTHLVKATDYCGVKSGRDVDKFKEMDLTLLRDEETTCPMIGESPVNIVCRTKEIKELGSHHMFIADVLHVYIDEAYLDEKGKFHLNATNLLAYSHGSYLSLGEELGSFGYSIRKKELPKKKVKSIEQLQNNEIEHKKKYSSTSLKNRKMVNHKKDNEKLVLDKERPQNLGDKDKQKKSKIQNKCQSKAMLSAIGKKNRKKEKSN